LCLAGWPAAARADSVLLKNGNRMEGRVVEETEHVFIVDVGIGTVTVPRHEVDQVARDPAPPAPAARERPAPVRAEPLPALGLRSAPAVKPVTLTLPPPPPAPEIEAYADQLLPVVVGLRGLPLLRPVEKRVADRSAIRQRLQELLDELADTPEASRRKIEQEGKALRKLGLLPAGVDYPETVLRMYTDALAGYYDPQTQVLYLADWVTAKEQTSILAHELVHALQDQHFGLASFLEVVKDDEEAGLARRAVVEGEAFAVQMDMELQPLGTSFTEVGDLATFYEVMRRMTEAMAPAQSPLPPFLQQVMAFPYIHGGAFIQTALRRHGWPGLRMLYRDPPATTEQILHPEKYLDARDPPRSVVLPELPEGFGEAWQPIWESAVGEFAMAELIRQYADGRVAASSAGGWGGDRCRLYEHRDTRQQLLVWVSVWDTSGDAAEFATAYPWVILGKYAREEAVPGAAGTWTTEADDVTVERRGDAVVVVEGVPGELRAPLLRSLWAAVDRSG
jgi:hypothetical protein